MNLRPLAPLFLTVAAACSDDTRSAASNDASKFIGKWTYQQGSAIVVDCPGAAEQMIDLSKVPPANQPGYFSFSAMSGTEIHEVDARSCAFDWTVAGSVATAATNQSCTTFPDGHGGNRVVQMTSGTKTTSADGASISVDVHFTSAAGPSCTIAVKGVAQKS